jgi:YVTN family beta-propeller protein
MRYSVGFLFIFLLSCGPKSTDITPVSFEKNSAYIINGGDNSISIIDTKSFAEKGRYYFKTSGNFFAHHIYFSDDYSKLAIAFPEYDFSNGHGGLHGASVKGKVGILNLKDQSQQIFDIPFANHNAVFSTDKKEIWTGLVSHSGKIQVYDIANYALIKEISVGSDPSELILAKDGELALVACGETSFLTVIDTKTKAIVKEIKIDPFPTNVWPGWDMSTIFVENANAKSLNIIDLDKMKVIDFLDFDFVPGFMAFNTFTNELWVCAPKANKVIIYQKDSLKWNKKSEIMTDNDPHQLAFLKDGKTVLVVNQKSNSLHVIDAQTKKILKSLNVGIKPNGIAIWE